MSEPTPREILAASRADALAMSDRAGTSQTRAVLERAQADLLARIGAIQTPGQASFSRVQLNATLAQVRAVLGQIGTGMTRILADGAVATAEKATEGTLDYLGRVQASFRGIVAPLDLDTASMFEAAKVGARTSILRRLASSGEGAPGAPKDEHAAKPGILARYGLATIGDFEQELQTGILARRSWAEQKAAIVTKSSFLQGKPAFWAERIVRTESMGAYARGAWEANREADDQLGDMLKILSATFDGRTGSDSIAVHGQIRRPDEAFESWFGLYQHPPNRPNDREVICPHRISWPLPPYLVQRPDAEIAARWKHEKRKGSPPPRPKMTTVPLSSLGKAQPLPEAKKRGEALPEDDE